MPTLEEYSRLPIEARLRRLEQTPGELERDLTDKTDTELSRRPAAHNWAAKEIVCHLRDVVLLRSLSPVEWQRGGIHLSQGRLTLADWVARLAAHDDNHVTQLRRALEGRA